MLHSSSLPQEPDPVDPQARFLKLEFSFGRDSYETHLSLETAEPEIGQMASFWLPYKQQGPAYLNGHKAWFSLTLPDPFRHEGRARLHVAVRFVDPEELHDPLAIAHRQDFDRLMDIVQSILGEMVESGLILPLEHPIDIVVEPLSPTGQLKAERIDFASFAIGATWLTYRGRQIFTDFRKWNPSSGRWEREGK